MGNRSSKSALRDCISERSILSILLHLAVDKARDEAEDADEGRSEAKANQGDGTQLDVAQPAQAHPKSSRTTAQLWAL